MAFSFCLPLTAAANGVWKSQESGTLAWLRSVYFLDANKGWAVGGAGTLLMTNDGGKRWQPARRPTEDTINDIHFTSPDTGWLLCERSVYLLKTKDEPRSYLLKTSDGGATWQRVEITGADVDVRLVRVVFADRERGWAFGEVGALYMTNDGGATWTRQRLPSRNLLLGGAFLDNLRGWLVGAGGTVLQTTDGGASWRAGLVEVASAAMFVAGSPRFNAVSFADARRGWAVGAGGVVYVTNTGGRTWRAQTSNTKSDLHDVRFFDANEGWAAGTDGTLIHTTDGGETWRVEPSGTAHPLARLFFAGRTRGWAVGFGGTIISYAPAAALPPQPPQLRTPSISKND